MMYCLEHYKIRSLDTMDVNRVLHSFLVLKGKEGIEWIPYWILPRLFELLGSQIQHRKVN